MKAPSTKLSIVMPCFNEELALTHCILEIEEVLQKHALSAEVIIVDNASTDRSSAIIQKHISMNPNIKLVTEKSRGYGLAYLTGFRFCTGSLIFMADADGSYDFRDIPRFIEKLESGADLVVGNRFAHTIKADAMPWHHRYIGNPFLSFLVKKMFNIQIQDIHCGIRAITKEGLQKLQLHASGMEFASEMIIEAKNKKLILAEIPVKYRKRLGVSKLRSFIDGFRHVHLIVNYFFKKI